MNHTSNISSTFASPNLMYLMSSSSLSSYVSYVRHHSLLPYVRRLFVISLTYPIFLRLNASSRCSIDLLASIIRSIRYDRPHHLISCILTLDIPYYLMFSITHILITQQSFDASSQYSIDNPRIYWSHPFFYTIYCTKYLFNRIRGYLSIILSKSSIFALFPPKVIGSSLQLTIFHIRVPTETL